MINLITYKGRIKNMYQNKNKSIQAIMTMFVAISASAIFAMTFISFLDVETTIEDRFVPEYNQMLSELLDEITNDCKAVADIDGVFVLEAFKVCMKQSVIGIKNEGIITPQEKNELFAIINHLPEDYCQCELEPPNLVVPNSVSQTIDNIPQLIDTIIDPDDPRNITIRAYDSFDLPTINIGGAIENAYFQPGSVWDGFNPPANIPLLPGFEIVPNADWPDLDWGLQFIGPEDENRNIWGYVLVVENCAGTSEVNVCVNCFE